jgi:hypothetical protein
MSGGVLYMRADFFCLQVELARGNRMRAKAQYEKILGKSLRGYGPSEHWAHAEYALLLSADGDGVGALEHMKMALDVASLHDSKADPSEVAQYSFQLGKMLWEQPEAKECALGLLMSV